MAHSLRLFLQDHDTPLILAVENTWDIDMIKLLLEKGADCNAKNEVSYNLRIYIHIYA